jgi:hypothetical protein
MDDFAQITSANFNEIWLKNIYENITKFEFHEGLARDGCETLFEYLQIPLSEVKTRFADTQYKNLRFMFTQLHLLISDVEPIIKEVEADKFFKELDDLEKDMNNKKMFIRERYSASRRGIVSSEVTQEFEKKLGDVVQLKRKVINSIKHLIFIESKTPTW